MDPNFYIFDDGDWCLWLFSVLSIFIFNFSLRACDLSQMDATLLLLGAKANVNAVDKEGQTPLHKVSLSLSLCLPLENGCHICLYVPLFGIS